MSALACAGQCLACLNIEWSEVYEVLANNKLNQRHEEELNPGRIQQDHQPKALLHCNDDYVLESALVSAIPSNPPTNGMPTCGGAQPIPVRFLSASIHMVSRA